MGEKKQVIMRLWREERKNTEAVGKKKNNKKNKNKKNKNKKNLLVFVCGEDRNKFSSSKAKQA